MSKAYRKGGGVSVDRVAEARERLGQMTTTLADTAEFRALLKMRAKFHRYSLNNTFLIRLQSPEAVAVKGFKGWLDLGRQVRKGEKAIYILAPRPYRKTETDETGAEVQVAKVAYATVAVFDLGQTDPIEGHPNPFALPARFTNSGDPALATHLFDILSTLLFDSGVDVLTGPSRHGEGGSYHPATKTINVTQGHEPSEAFSVLVHEVGHHYSMHVEPGNYQAGEVIAESIAFLVCDHFGFDNTASSPDYLAHWIRDDATKLDVAVDHIVTTATRLINELTEALGEAEEAPLAA